MSTSSLYNSTASLARKHSRVSLLAAGAAAAGMLGVAGVSIGSAPMAHAIGNVVTTANTSSQGSSSYTDTSALDEVLGVQAHTTQPAKQQPAASHTSPRLRLCPRPRRQRPRRRRRPRQPREGGSREGSACEGSGGRQAAAPAKAKLAAAAPRPAQHKAAQPSGPTRPYTIYDSVTPGSLPASQPAAVYADGAYAASSSQVSGHHSVLWIDANGSDPNANVLDVEPGDATPAGAATWVQSHLGKQPHSVAIIYTMRSDWSAVQDAVGGLPSWEQSHVRYWIADPTGHPHVVPGSSATQWYWAAATTSAPPTRTSRSSRSPAASALAARRVPPFPQRWHPAAAETRPAPPPRNLRYALYAAPARAYRCSR